MSSKEAVVSASPTRSWESRSLLAAGLAAREAGQPADALAYFQAAAILNPATIWPPLEAAAELFGSNRLDEAEAAYTQALAISPTAVQAHLGLGRCARRRGQRETALAAHLAAQHADPDNPWGGIEAGHDMRELGRLGEAEQVFNAVLARHPNQPAALLGLAECARRRNDMPAALAIHQAAVQADPGNIWTWLETATDLRELARLEEAEATYRQALILAPDQIEAHLGLGQCARLRHDTPAALAAHQAAIAAAPGRIWGRLEAATDLWSLGRTAEAEALYAAVLATEPGQVQALVGLGRCARARGDAAAALASHQEAAAREPDNVWCHLEQAADLAALDRTAEAQAEYTAALALAPMLAAGHLGLGRCARARGDLAAALTHHRDAGQADPANIWGRLEAAADLRELGRLDEAEAEYQTVLAEHPGQVAALLGLGQCSRRRGDCVAALAWHRRADAAAPGAIWGALESAADLRDLGQIGEARAILARLLSQAPGQARVLVNAGQCERVAGDRTAAILYLERAVATDPADPGPRLELATDHRDMGNIEAARALARAVLAEQPGHLRALLSLGHTESFAGDHAAALAAFKAAHLGHLAEPEPLLHMALCERTRGHQDRCDALFARLAIEHPGYVPLLIHQAEQARMANDMPAAFVHYRSGLDLAPANISLRLGLVETLALMGRMDDALGALDAFEVEQGAAPQVQQARIGLLRRAGHSHAALQVAREATAAAPYAFATWVARLDCEILVGDDDAIDACLAAAPAVTLRDRATMAYKEGQVRELRQDFEQARACYETSASLNPFDAAVQHDLARLGFLALDLQRARTHLRRFCSLLTPITRLRRRSLNLSQTHLGQILDEYELDAAVGQEVRQARALPPSERLSALLRIVRANSASTAAAVDLMRLVAGQRMSQQHESPGKPTADIPKRIVQFWDKDEVPPELITIMQSWTVTNPDWQYLRFSERTAGEILASSYHPQVAAIFSGIREPAQKADLFRLGYLAAHGGLYVDADDRCLAPLDELLPPAARLVLYQEDFGTVGNNIIAVEARHPVTRLAFQWALMAVARGDSDLLWLSTGPGLLTRALAHVLAHSELDDPMWLTLSVLDRRTLFKSVAVHCLAGYKATELHWSNASFGRTSLRTNTAEDAPAAPDGLT